MLFVLSSVRGVAQQDPQYTQYMYNTMSVNPGYAGSRDALSIHALGRTQWVGVDGAPNTQTVSLHSPIGYSGLNLGLSVVNDAIGPLNELYFDTNTSYSIRLNETANLSVGLKLGLRFFNVDWAKGQFKNPDQLLSQNINKILPTIGAGIYYYNEKSYLGLAVPNFFRSEHYDRDVQSLAVEQYHYFLIGGYVLRLNDTLKFKPAFLSKIVQGAPLSLDLSANFLFHERFTAGLGYRWGDSISALLGFQVNRKFHLGFAYDYTNSDLRGFNNGSYEIMMRYEIPRGTKIISPRFF